MKPPRFEVFLRYEFIWVALLLLPSSTRSAPISSTLTVRLRVAVCTCMCKNRTVGWHSQQLDFIHSFQQVQTTKIGWKWWIYIACVENAMNVNEQSRESAGSLLLHFYIDSSTRTISWTDLNLGFNRYRHQQFLLCFDTLFCLFTVCNLKYTTWSVLLQNQSSCSKIRLNHCRHTSKYAHVQSNKL